MEFATNSIGVSPLTPDQAADFLKCNYEHQRKIRPAHVAYLLNEMRNGRFMPTAEVHIMYRNGERVLVNGQHTCAAIVEYGKPVTVTLRKTIATEAGQVAMAYAFGHDTGLRRTYNDALSSYNIMDSTGLTSTQVNALASTLRFIKDGFVSGRSGGGATMKLSPADLVEDVYAWSPEVKLLYTVTARGDGRAIRAFRKRGILSVAIITIGYCPDMALDFWKGIAAPDMLAWNDPRVMARKIIEASLVVDAGDRHRPSLTSRLARQMARCWNAFHNNEKQAMVKVLNDTAPIVLYGTPYNGKQPKDFLPNKPNMIMSLAA